MIQHQSIVVEQINQRDEIPYHLLLLADETTTAINKYLFNADMYVAKDVVLNHVVGVVVVQKIEVNAIEIKNIAVDEVYQGRGIGSFLIDEIKRIGRKQGMQTLWVGTPDTATRQLLFYKRNGFLKCGRKHNFYIDNYPEPIYENGIMLKDMIMLRTDLDNVISQTSP